MNRTMALEHGKIEIGGPCNGIILLGETFILPDSKTYPPDCHSPIYLCNPATRELWKIRNRPFWCGYDSDWMTHSLGLGFDHLTDQFKIVSILAYTYRKEYVCGFQTSVFYSGSDSWRLDYGPDSWKLPGYQIMPTVNVGGFVGPLDLNCAPGNRGGYLLDGCGLFLNGCIHWRMAISELDEEFILSFDVSSEEMRAISRPRGVEVASETLLMVGDCLALAVKGRTVPCLVDVWVMGEYGATESWEKRFCVGPFDKIPRVLACWDDDMLHFETVEGELASCGLRKDVGGQLRKHGVFGSIDVEKDVHLGAIVVQKESLVSLSDKYWESQCIRFELESTV